MPDSIDIPPSDPASSQSHGPAHEPVLVEPILELFNPQAGQSCLDCTVGRGGHAKVIAPKLAPGGRYIGLDVDPGNVAFAQERLASAAIDVHVHHANFSLAGQVLASQGIEKVDLLLADLGFASNQMDDPSRGFSFQYDGPLDMRLDPTLGTTAADLVNRLPEPELADLIYQYGEERLSRRIARKIVERRKQSPIKQTGELAELIRHCYPRVPRSSDRTAGRSKGRGKQIHPATRTFMALRIAVNGELEALEGLLSTLPQLVSSDGIAAIISFHSLEDRLVKRAFLAMQQSGRARRLTTKPIIADDNERRRNPRSRSAKLRVIRFGQKKYAAKKKWDG